MKVDFGVGTDNEVEAWSGGALMPPGRHLCTLDQVAEGTSSGGHPQIEVTMVVAAGAHIGCSARDWIVVTDNSLGRVRQFLEAAGVEINEGEFEIPFGALLGRKVTVLARQGHKPDGSEKLEIAAYMSPDAAGADVPVDDLPGEPVGAGARDDDIPF